MERLTFEQIVADKRLTSDAIAKDLAALKKFSADKNERKFCGNPTLYHFQMANLCKTSVKDKPSLFQVMNDDALYAKLYQKAQKLKRTGTLANRLFEAERFNGAVVFFKPTTAKWLYKKFGATSVLDPTAGWGGRLLGADALGISYTGIDTNVSLKPAYTSMMEILGGNHKMIWDDCLKVDFSTIDYDFVLTSPPYINLEVYENMSKFKDDSAFYKNFLIPLIEKCLAHIKNKGRVCFNISPKMYADLLKAGFRACNEEYDLLQQKRLGNDKQDKIYCWV
tara:strand:- start:33 stop:872 length:840 start_codon:yes stop_codon:yes gene_type:complete